jgi:hypothetical protein
MINILGTPYFEIIPMVVGATIVCGTLFDGNDCTLGQIVTRENLGIVSPNVNDCGN